ncbi:MAG: hypothetical protein ACRC92_27235 [Peptostreptococcaceae bacterium]
MTKEEKFLSMIETEKGKKSRAVGRMVQAISDLNLNKSEDYKSMEDIDLTDLEKYVDNKIDDDAENEFKLKLRNTYEIALSILRYDYVIERATMLEDGSLDTFIASGELSKLELKAREDIFRNKAIESYTRNASTMKDALKGLNELNFDLRVKYELNKMILCNSKGYTPESVDDYIMAIRDYNEEHLNVLGSNSIKGGVIQNDEVNEKFSHLLKKVENWDGESVIYDSEFIEKYKQELDEIEANRPKTGPTAELYDALVKLNNNLVKTKKFKIDSTSMKQEASSAEVPKVVVTKNTVDSIREQRRLAREARSKKIEDKLKARMGEEFDYNTLINPTVEPEITEAVVVEEVIVKDEPVIVDTPKVEEVVIEEVTVEKKDDTVRRPDVQYNVDDVFKVVEVKPDLSILKSNSPNKVQLYKESHKYGRLLYLPYSNYEILLKRITNRNQINYVAELLADKRLLNDKSLEFELMRIIYNNTEFFFTQEVSEFDFYKCLSIKDIPLIISQLALISNVPEVPGVHTVNIDSVICFNSSCERRWHLAKPYPLDLEKKFKEIYPIDLYYKNYNTYKEKEYASIYLAFKDSISESIGSFSVVDKDTNLKYTVVTGRPTFFTQSYEIEKRKDQALYLIYLDSLSEEIKIRDDEKLHEMYEYSENKSIIDLQLRITEIISMYSNIPDLANDATFNPVDYEPKIESLVNEYRLIQDMLMNVEQYRANLEAYFSIILSIKYLSIESLDLKEVVVETKDFTDLYELFINVSNMPDEMFKKIHNAYNEYLDDMINYDHKSTMITVTGEEIKNYISIEKSYKSLVDFKAELDVVYKENEKVKQDFIQAREKTIKAIKEEGACSCGTHEFFINHFNLLFFSLTQAQGVKIGQQ